MAAPLIFSTRRTRLVVEPYSLSANAETDGSSDEPFRARMKRSLTRSREKRLTGFGRRPPCTPTSFGTAPTATTLA